MALKRPNKNSPYYTVIANGFDITKGPSHRLIAFSSVMVESNIPLTSDKRESVFNAGQSRVALIGNRNRMKCLWVGFSLLYCRYSLKSRLPFCFCLMLALYIED